MLALATAVALVLSAPAGTEKTQAFLDSLSDVDGVSADTSTRDGAANVRAGIVVASTGVTLTFSGGPDRKVLRVDQYKFERDTKGPLGDSVRATYATRQGGISRALEIPCKAGVSDKDVMTVDCWKPGAVVGIGPPFTSVTWTRKADELQIESRAATVHAKLLEPRRKAREEFFDKLVARVSGHAKTPVTAQVQEKDGWVFAPKSAGAISAKGREIAVDFSLDGKPARYTLTLLSEWRSDADSNAHFARLVAPDGVERICPLYHSKPIPPTNPFVNYAAPTPTPEDTFGGASPCYTGVTREAVLTRELDVISGFRDETGFTRNGRIQFQANAERVMFLFEPGPDALGKKPVRVDSAH